MREQIVLELTYNHDGRAYELGTGDGHIALAVRIPAKIGT